MKWKRKKKKDYGPQLVDPCPRLEVMFFWKCLTGVQSQAWDDNSTSWVWMGQRPNVSQYCVATVISVPRPSWEQCLLYTPCGIDWYIFISVLGGGLTESTSPTSSTTPRLPPSTHALLPLECPVLKYPFTLVTMSLRPSSQDCRAL